MLFYDYQFFHKYNERVANNPKVVHENSACHYMYKSCCI